METHEHCCHIDLGIEFLFCVVRVFGVRGFAFFGECAVFLLVFLLILK